MQANLAQHHLADFAIVESLVEGWVFDAINRIAPAPGTNLTEHRTTFIAAHGVSPTGQAHPAFLAQLHGQMTTLANGAALNDEAIAITSGSVQPLHIEANINQYQHEDAQADNRFWGQ